MVSGVSPVGITQKERFWVMTLLLGVQIYSHRMIKVNEWVSGIQYPEQGSMSYSIIY
jgi:hypothetical protein